MFNLRDNVYITGHPCPLCRDEYLVVDASNIRLISQFICPETDQLYGTGVTHVCRAQHLMLQVAVERARRRAWIIYRIPPRQYDYDLYYGKHCVEDKLLDVVMKAKEMKTVDLNAVVDKLREQHD
ncbi:hypothetical protein ACOME3_003601 [Neoechinorhynchus agilis]